MTRRLDLTETERTILRELIKISTTQIDDLLVQTHRRHPEAALCDSLRRWRETATGLTERLSTP